MRSLERSTFASRAAAAAPTTVAPSRPSGLKALLRQMTDDVHADQAERSKFRLVRLNARHGEDRR